MPDDEIAKHRATKNRRTWCKGKVGVQHTPKCVDYQATKHWMAGTVVLDGWKILLCTTCGKELQTWMPSSVVPQKRPHWVTDT